MKHPQTQLNPIILAPQNSPAFSNMDGWHMYLCSHCLIWPAHFQRELAGIVPKRMQENEMLRDKVALKEQELQVAFGCGLLFWVPQQ
jgi:hypothetical protein